MSNPPKFLDSLKPGEMDAVGETFTAVLKTVVARLEDTDSFLLQHALHELSISHKLANYLEEEIRKSDKEFLSKNNLSIDSEYNKLTTELIENQHPEKQISYRHIHDAIDRLGSLPTETRTHILKTINCRKPEDWARISENTKKQFPEAIKIEKQQRRIRPDIIIHERGRNEKNLLALEIKIQFADKCAILFDLAKLSAMTADHTLKYQFGWFLCFSRQKQNATGSFLVLAVAFWKGKAFLATDDIT